MRTLLENTALKTLSLGKGLVSNSGRRVLYPITASSAHCYRVLVSFSVDLSSLHGSSVGGSSGGTSGVVFSCKQCFSKLDKMFKNKEALNQLCGEVSRTLAQIYPATISGKSNAGTQTKVSECCYDHSSSVTLLYFALYCSDGFLFSTHPMFSATLVSSSNVISHKISNF